MPQVLIRDVEDRVIKALKARAKRHHRSLQGELKAIVTDAAQGNLVDADLLAKIDALRNRLKGRKHTDSVELLREDRARQ